MNVFASRSVMLSTSVLLVLHIIDSMWSICSQMITAKTRSNLSHYMLQLLSLLLKLLPFGVDRLGFYPSSHFRMLQHWSVRWTLQVVWMLTLCCISLSVYEPEQCSRWDLECFSFLPWSHLSHSMITPKWKKMNAVCRIKHNVYTAADCVLDAAVPVCNVAVWNWVQRERLHCCCDSCQPGYPQRIGWGKEGWIERSLL